VQLINHFCTYRQPNALLINHFCTQIRPGRVRNRLINLSQEDVVA